MTKKINYGKEQEIFAKLILNHVLRSLIYDGFLFKTYTGEYNLIGTDLIGTPDGGEQLTDKIISLKYSRNGIELIESYIFIESKAYLKGVSNDSVNGSFEAFENKLPQFGSIGYGSIYLIFRGLENRSDFYLIKKRIEEDEKLPDHYFEIAKEDFINKNGQNDLIELFKNMKTDSSNTELVKNYIQENSVIISNLKQKLQIELRQAFTKYETSEKRLNFVLKDQHILDKSHLNIINSCDYRNGFQFDCTEVDLDLNKAKEEQEKYLLNKHHYFANPLIRKNINEIENEIWDNIFPELNKRTYGELSLCTNEFLDEFGSLNLVKASNQSTMKYLFEGGKKQKRGFLFDSGSREKCLLHYQTSTDIQFISKLNHD